MINIPRKRTLPGKQTRAYKLLELIAIFGEFPTDLLPRISGGDSYKETIITSLKQKGLIKTYYADGLRGLRVTNTAKKLLMADNPKRFASFMDENSDINHVRSEPHRRERLYRIAETTVTMKNAGVSIFRDERPAIFSQSGDNDVWVESPAFYPSREIREVGYQFSKMKGARSVGALLTEENIFITYCLGDALIKWSFKSEMRTKSLIQSALCLGHLSRQYSPESIHGLLLGNSMELALEILKRKKQQYLILDDNFENFYFVTKDRKGEMLLRLLCNPALCEELDEILTDDLCPAREGALIENDAMTEDGKPVLLAYKCDLKRIQKFDTALTLQNKRGIIICFDYQAEVLRRYCGEAVEFQTLDFEKTERRFFS